MSEIEEIKNEESKNEESKNEELKVMRIEKIFTFQNKTGAFLHDYFYVGYNQFNGLSFDMKYNVNMEISKIFEKLDIYIINGENKLTFFDKNTGGYNLNDVNVLYKLDKYKLNNKIGKKILNNSILNISGLTGEFVFLIDYKIYDYYYSNLKGRIELNFIIIETIEK